MPEYIVLEPLAVAQLMLKPEHCLVTKDYIAVMVGGNIVVIPGDFSEADTDEVNQKIQTVCKEMISTL